MGSAFAHPHFPKETTFRWDREDSPEARKITVTHITVPYNEIKAGELPAGESWHLGFAKLRTTVDLESGGTPIAAGEYELKGKREAEDRWSLELVSGKEEDRKTLAPKCEFEKGFPVAHHLSIETHPDGEKESTTVWVSVMFGDMRVRFPVAPN
jgi:hypothetical protein